MSKETTDGEQYLLSALLLRLVVAMEKQSRHFSAIEELLLTCVDGNDKTLRMKDVDRAKVYSKHLGKKLKQT